MLKIVLVHSEHLNHKNHYITVCLIGHLNKSQDKHLLAGH